MNSRPEELNNRTVSIIEVTKQTSVQRSDQISIEEPLEIRAVSGPEDRRKGRSLSVTMRTPGHDFELAAGFLFTEGIIQRTADITGLEFCGPAVGDQGGQNIVRVNLAPDLNVDLGSLQRNFFMTSSCGICGKASLDAIEIQRHGPIVSDLSIPADVVFKLPEQLRAAQPLFRQTGGIHAAGLFDPEGNLISIKEDVGRHNAVDKLIGEFVLADQLDMSHRVLVVSGRASFELLQKAAMAGVPIFVAVGAPSSLAVDGARRFGITLLGFTSTERFNIYSKPNRINDG